MHGFINISSLCTLYKQSHEASIEIDTRLVLKPSIDLAVFPIDLTQVYKFPFSFSTIFFHTYLSETWKHGNAFIQNNIPLSFSLPWGYFNNCVSSSKMQLNVPESASGNMPLSELPISICAQHTKQTLVSLIPSNSRT